MLKRNTLVFIIVLIIFALALAIVFPVNKGLLGNKGVRLGLDLQGGIHIVYQADLSSVEPGEEENALDGVMAVLSNRINPLGVTEPLIQKQGSDRILVELPGLSITDKEKESLSRVAVLEFGELTDNEAEAKWQDELGMWKPATATINGEEKTLSSRYFLENTYVAQDSLCGIELHFEWNDEGGQLSEAITGRLIGQPLGIFEGDEPLTGEDGRPIAPTVQATITS